MTRPRKRRQHGTGSVYPLADGRWKGSIDAGFTATGGRRRITVTGATEAEVKRRLVERQRQLAEGDADVSTRTTVKAWAETWLEITARDLRPKSWNADRAAITRWIVPTIGKRRLDQLTPRDIRAVGDACRAADLSSSSIHRYHVTLLSMLRAAIAEGHGVPRRVLDVKAPALAVSDRTAMSIPEALAILYEASFLPHGSRWAMAFLHGMRQGECLGLTWEQVDLENALVTVRWQLQELPYRVKRDPSSGFQVPDGIAVRHLTGRWHLTPPKTKAGIRPIPLTPGMAEALRDWRNKAPASEWGLVWPAADGRPAAERDDREEWYGLQSIAGVGHPNGRYYTLHEARHTTATQLLEGGVDPKIVTELLGHSSIVTSRGYQHVSTPAALAALEAVAGRLQIRDRES